MLPLSVRLAPSRFLDPALLLLVVLGVALYWSFRRTTAVPATPAPPRARWPRILAWVTWAALWLLSMPLVSSTLTGCTETRGPDLSAALSGKDRQKAALVVLTGAPPDQTAAMLDLMTTLGVPPDRVVLETRALTAYSAEILRARGAEVVVLVTSATHLRRAVKDFAAVGIDVIPAAADVMGRSRTGVDSLLPSASALAQSHVCLHEILGYLRG